MPGGERPVDAAMAEERPAKQRIREIWVNEVRQQKATTAPELPFYLTLSGAAGLDIQRLIEEEVIVTTESGAIADTDNERVISVERDSLAVLEIARRFPGLKIIEGDIFNELRGASPIRYPEEREKRRIYQATVINLDLTRPLTYDDNRENFPQLEGIIKLADIHRSEGYVDWRLLLTFQGGIYWSTEVQQNVQSFLIEYSQAHADIGMCVNKVLGEDVYTMLQAGQHINLAEIETEAQQSFVMLFVPLYLIVKLTSQGWLVEVTHSIRYGGEADTGTAPIVTWAIRLRHDIRTPLTLVNESLTTLSTSCARIDIEGNFIKLALYYRCTS
jgi:hypothetical protein